MRRRFGLLVLVGALVATAVGCLPDPPAPPPPDSDTFVVYGDSIVVESSAHLRDRLHDLLPGWTIVVRGVSGTAQCDWHDPMRADAQTLRPRGVLLAFWGNDLTPCIMSRDYAQGWHEDIDWAVGFWRDQGVPLAMTADPALVGLTLAQRTVGNLYAAAAAEHGLALAETAPFFSRGPTSLFTTSMPCLVGECAGEIAVRNADGIHQCPAFDPVNPCPVYSSGIVRFVEVIVHAVATELGLSQPPYRTMVSTP